MTGSQTDPGHTIEHMTAILRRHLESTWTGKKAPYGISKALELARSKQPVSARDQTELIFLGSGLQAWVAYFFSNRANIRHFLGQKTELKTIDDFDLLTEDQRMSVAKEIAGIEAHQSVGAVIQSLSMSPTKRRRLTDSTEHSSTHPQPEEQQETLFENSITNPSYTNAITPDSFEQQTVSNISTIPQPGGEHETISNTEKSSTNSAYTNANPTNSISDLIEAPSRRGLLESFQLQQTVSQPAMKHIGRVFPQYMCGAITTVGDRAAITITFPPSLSGKVECLMSLAIRANKVEFIAIQLFGIHVETEDGFRCIVLENGARCVPGRDTSLQGARPEAISKLLGSDISCAIAASLAREDEVRQSIFATRCVTMQIARNPDEGAILNLNLGLDGGFETKDKLFI